MPIADNKKRLVFILLGALILLLTGCVFGERVPYKPPPKKLGLGDALFLPKDNLIMIELDSIRLKGICLIDYQGKVVKIIKNYGQREGIYSPIFSPDGKNIAFYAYKSGDSDGIFIMDANGNNLRQLTLADGFWDFSPQFSFDGKGIFFLRHMNTGCYRGDDPPCPEGLDFYYVPIEVGKEIKLTHEEFALMDDWKVLPGNRYIVLSYLPYGHRGHPFVKFDIRNPKKPIPIIPDLTKYSSDPRAISLKGREKYLEIERFVLTRDGRYLVFAWDDPNKSQSGKGSLFRTQIYLTDMKTMETTRLTNHEHVIWPADISDDGKKILFYMGKSPNDYGQTVFPKTQLWIINSDGTGLRNIPLDFSAVADQFPPKAPAAGKSK